MGTVATSLLNLSQLRNLFTNFFGEEGVLLDSPEETRGKAGFLLQGAGGIHLEAACPPPNKITVQNKRKFSITKQIFITAGFAPVEKSWKKASQIRLKYRWITSTFQLIPWESPDTILPNKRTARSSGERTSRPIFCVP